MKYFYRWKFLKEVTLDWGEIFDALRFVPRIILILYGFLIWDAYTWIKSLEVITTQAAGVFSALVGSASVVVGLYNGTGRKWQLENRSNWFLDKIGVKLKEKDNVENHTD